MNRADISITLESIHPELSQINNKTEKAALAKILNLVEILAARIDELEHENQSLKDEINRLKGEQGKPDIKANKKQDGDIASENERLEAEETDEDKANKIGFKLNKSALEKLKEQRLPVQLLEQLEVLQGHKYSNEIEFIHEIEAVIGTDLTNEYRELLLQYARYKKRNRPAKIPKISIDRREDCPVDRSQLPEDAVLKDHEYKVVQDVIIKTDTVEFKRELYYSPSLKKCYLGAVPEGYDQGDFGPHIHADILAFKYVNGMTIPKIVEFYQNIGIFISGSYISTRTTDPKFMGVFHDEKSEAFKAAIEVSAYLQIDETGSRVKGQNHSTQILCNHLFTAFFTTQHKNRLTILDILQHFGSRHFLLNQKTVERLEQLGVSKTDQQLVMAYQRDTAYNEAEILDLLQTLYADKYPRKRTRIMEACAISCYRQETGIAIVDILVCDDAPQFKLLTDLLALCWIHNGRHYKRLNPLVPLHQEKLDDCLTSSSA